MLGKILKFFSSDRSEEPVEAPKGIGMAEMQKLRQGLAQMRIELKDATLREVALLLHKGAKIDAIKVLREEGRPKMGLKEAKDAAEELEKYLS